MVCLIKIARLEPRQSTSVQSFGGSAHPRQRRPRLGRPVDGMVLDVELVVGKADRLGADQDLVDPSRAGGEQSWLGWRGRTSSRYCTGATKSRGMRGCVVSGRRSRFPGGEGAMAESVSKAAAAGAPVSPRAPLSVTFRTRGSLSSAAISVPGCRRSAHGGSSDGDPEPSRTTSTPPDRAAPGVSFGLFVELDRFVGV